MSAEMGKPAAIMPSEPDASSGEVDEHQVYTEALMMRRRLQLSTERTASKEERLWPPHCRRSEHSEPEMLSNSNRRKRSHTETCLFPWCYGNQRGLLARDSENWCVAMATASSSFYFQWQLWWTQSFWASLAVVCRSIRHLFICQVLCEIQSCLSLSRSLSLRIIIHPQSEAVQHLQYKHRWPTAQRTLTNKHGPTRQRRAF